MEKLAELVDASLKFSKVLKKKGVSQATLKVRTVVHTTPDMRGSLARKCMSPPGATAKQMRLCVSNSTPAKPPIHEE
eukprot:1179281-Prorocentrum_minimum.AAC.2